MAFSFHGCYGRNMGLLRTTVDYLRGNGNKRGKRDIFFAAWSMLRPPSAITCANGAAGGA
jgi:hypothetical protein